MNRRHWLLSLAACLAVAPMQANLGRRSAEVVKIGFWPGR